jgi:hypothetical protein
MSGHNALERVRALRYNRALLPESGPTPMARITELARLFHAVASADWQSARSLAEMIVKTEEDAGHHAAATTLRGALSSTGPRQEHGRSDAALPILLPSLPDLLTPLPPAKLEEVQLPVAGRKRLEALVLEHKHRARLKSHGLPPRSRLFFHGPPGCGKTLTHLARSWHCRCSWFASTVWWDHT